jgi:Fur family ferric uptake transcriptional regulator
VSKRVATSSDASLLPEEIGERLSRAGIRSSAPRRAVIEALVASGGHFSREELALRMRAAGPRVSLSTVYRFMRVLVDLGIAREIRIGDTSRFELDLGREQHDHLVCVACGGIVEFQDGRLGEIARQIAETYHFTTVIPQVEIRAKCRVCSG